MAQCSSASDAVTRLSGSVIWHSYPACSTPVLLLAESVSRADLKDLAACRQLDLSTYYGDPPVMWPGQQCEILLRQLSSLALCNAISFVCPQDVVQYTIWVPTLQPSCSGKHGGHASPGAAGTARLPPTVWQGATWHWSIWQPEPGPRPYYILPLRGELGAKCCCGVAGGQRVIRLRILLAADDRGTICSAASSGRPTHQRDQTIKESNKWGSLQVNIPIEPANAIVGATLSCKALKSLPEDLLRFRSS